MSIRPAAIWSALLACLLAALALGPPAGASPPGNSAQATPAPPRAQHVVVVGLSGLRWSDVSAARTPTLWRLAGQGSVGSLVDYAVLPLTCPADGWLTLNAGARAQSDHTNAACGAFPAVRQAGAGATVPGLPALETYNQQFHNNPDWGLLGAPDPGLRHRRRPRRRARAGRQDRPRRLLPARTGPGHRGGAGPLPADRGGPGHARICRTVRGTRRRRRRTRPDRGGAAR